VAIQHVLLKIVYLPTIIPVSFTSLRCGSILLKVHYYPCQGPELVDMGVRYRFFNVDVNLCKKTRSFDW